MERMDAVEKLPEGTLAHVFSFLPARDVTTCMMCSKTFYNAAMSGTVWKKLCERLALDSLEEINVRALELGVSEEEDGPEYWRRAFIALQKNPLLRYRFLRTIPTLGLNVQNHETNENPRVFGGFSFNAPVENVHQPSNVTRSQRSRGRKRIKLTSDEMLKQQQQSLESNEKKSIVTSLKCNEGRRNFKKLVSDYACFKVRESVEVRSSHRQRMYECLDACTGRLKAVKLVGFGERPE